MEKELKSSNIFKKLTTAFTGLLIPYRTETSIRIQTAVVVAGTLFGWYLQISRTDWILLVLAAALLLITECINTAIEQLVNFVSPGYHEMAGKVKDIAAGAVFLAGTAALIICILVFVPYFNK
ncbi:MAG: diacylglycerol kinase family protein [Chitinophagaceae bacterium]|nr:diacylglycerol kinase family protein [Chitinophagaceae bacterium]